MFSILLGAFIGSFSILILFFRITSLQLFLIKIYLSIIMCLVVFGYKNLKYMIINIFSFYLVSVLLGGFLYLLNIEFSYKHEGVIFYNNGLSINVAILFIFAPLVLYIYIKQAKYLAKRTGNYYKVDLFLNRKKYNFTGYLDTGNTLIFKGKPVILINRKFSSKKKKIMVPYVVIGHTGVLECISVSIYVHNLGNFNVLLGYSENLNISGAEILLNGQMEGKYDWKNY